MIRSQLAGILSITPIFLIIVPFSLFSMEKEQGTQIQDLKILVFDKLMSHYSGQQLQKLAEHKKLNFFDFCEKGCATEKKLEQFRKSASDQLFNQIQPSKTLSESQWYAAIRPTKNQYVTFNANSKQIAFSCKDKIIWWDFETDKLQYIDIDKAAKFLIYHPDSKSLSYCIEKDARIKNINLTSKQTVDWHIEQSDVEYETTHAQFLDDIHLIIGLDNGKICKYNIKTKEQKELVYDHCLFPVYAMSINKPKKIIACGTGSDLAVWDQINQKPQAFNVGAWDIITRMAIDHAGEKIIMILAPHNHFNVPCDNVRSLDINTQQEINAITTERVWALANSADDTQFALRVGSNQEVSSAEIKLFDARTFKETAAIDQDSQRHWGLCYSPDNLLLATTCCEGVKMYDMRMIPKILAAIKTMTYKDLEEKRNAYENN